MLKSARLEIRFQDTMLQTLGKNPATWSEIDQSDATTDLDSDRKPSIASVDYL